MTTNSFNMGIAPARISGACMVPNCPDAHFPDSIVVCFSLGKNRARLCSKHAYQLARNLQREAAQA